MTFDLIAFMESVDQAIANIAAVEDSVTGRTSGDNYEVRGDCIVGMATEVSAGIASVAQWRFHHTRDPNWVDFGALFARDQTGAVDLHNLGYLNYPVKGGGILNAQVANSAAGSAQYEAVLMMLSYGGALPRPYPPPTVPAQAKWVKATATTTLVAATWTDVALTWSETFEKDVNYQILGLGAHSATAYAVRMLFPGSAPSKGFYPGCPAGDTALLNQIFYGDFGIFRGDQPPNVQMLASAGDTAEEVAMLVIDPSLTGG